jgi:hypothetical protein
MSACTRLDEVHAFVDGEMSAMNADAFRSHLASCAQCQEELEDVMQLSALGEELGEQDEAAPPVARPAPQPKAAPVAPPAQAQVIPLRRNWSRRVMVAATGLAAAAALLLVVRGQTGSAPFTLGEERTLEVRLTHPGATAYRPYNVARGGGDKPGAGPTLSQLAKLEEKGDWQGVATGHLLRGEKDQAAAALAKAAQGADIDSDRAAIALSRLSFEEALVLADRALAARPGHSQALWNKALALRELGLSLAAAEAFEAVAALHEPGWAAEATERARALRQLEAAAEKSYLEDRDAGKAWVGGGAAPAVEALRRHPGLFRLLAYDAMRAAPSRERAQALAPAINALQEISGGTALASTLRRVIEADFAARAPIAPLYAKLVAGTITAEEKQRLLDLTAKAGQADLRLGVLKLTETAPAHLDEFVALAQASRDPWFLAMAAQYEAKAQQASGAALLATQTLSKAFEACVASPEKVEFRCAYLAIDAVKAELPLTLVAEAWKHGQAGLTLLRSAGEWYVMPMLEPLAEVARFRGALHLSRAITREAALRQPHLCGKQAYARQNLAALAMLELDSKAARAELDAIPSCPGNLLSLATAEILAVVSRISPQPGDAARLSAMVEAQRQHGNLAPGQLALADYIEGRLLLESDKAAGRALLRKAIAAGDKLGRADENGQKARGYAFSTLALAAAKEGDFAAALELLAEEQGGPKPRTCTVGVAVDDERSVLIAQSDSGVVVGQFDGSRTEPVQAWTPRLTAEQEKGLRACAEVDVIARAPLHGRARLLPSDLAWSYRVGRPEPLARVPHHPRLLVVADAEAPAFLGLPRLLPWAEPVSSAGTPGARVELRGAFATPRRVLKELEEATEVEIHAHGLADLAVSNASLLVLSPDPSGDYALTAGQIRSTRLAGAPFVLLEGCQAAKEGVALHAPWSLPIAFIESGASAVLASTADLPDAKAGAFFEAIRTRVRGGQNPASALRDERLTWKTRGESGWTESVLAFQ